jgi:RNA polymerase sigma-70 factor, ECF subfamily
VRPQVGIKGVDWDSFSAQFLHARPWQQQGHSHRKSCANCHLFVESAGLIMRLRFSSKFPRRDRAGSVTYPVANLMSNSDRQDPEQLLQNARTADAAALGHLLELYRNYLGLLARLQIGRRLQRKVDESDLVQETFLEAHRHFGRFRGTTEGEFMSWLRQILAGVVANLVRHYGTQRRNVGLERQLADDLARSSQALAGELAARQSSPSQRAARREQAVLLADALGQLPEAYQEVIILSHLEGLAFPEVARRMGRSVASVKNLWARALARLRRALRDEL